MKINATPDVNMKAFMSLKHRCSVCKKEIVCDWKGLYSKYLCNDMYYIKIFTHHLKHKEVKKYKSCLKSFIKFPVKMLITAPYCVVVETVKGVIYSIRKKCVDILTETTKVKEKLKGNRNPIIISAFPASGKTYASENFKDNYTILDIGAYDFRKEDNLNYITNFIRYLKENINKFDIIFVYGEIEFRQAMTENNIDFYTIYPDEKSKELWIQRFKNEEYNDEFIEQISNDWDGLMKKIDAKEFIGKMLYRLDLHEEINSYRYIEESLLKLLSDYDKYTKKRGN